MLATMEQKLAMALASVTASKWLRSLASSLDVAGLPTTGEGTYFMFLWVSGWKVRIRIRVDSSLLMLSAQRLEAWKASELSGTG